MYKPGQLITKRVYGANRVFRIAKRNSCDSACNRCIIAHKGWHSMWQLGDSHICHWCANILGPDFYLKNP